MKRSFLILMPVLMCLVAARSASSEGTSTAPAAKVSLAQYAKTMTVVGKTYTIQYVQNGMVVATPVPTKATGWTPTAETMKAAMDSCAAAQAEVKNAQGAIVTAKKKVADVQRWMQQPITKFTGGMQTDPATIAEAQATRKAQYDSAVENQRAQERALWLAQRRLAERMAYLAAIQAGKPVVPNTYRAVRIGMKIGEAAPAAGIAYTLLVKDGVIIDYSVMYP